MPTKKAVKKVSKKVSNIGAPIMVKPEPKKVLEKRAYLFDKETGEHEYTFEQHSVDFHTEYSISLSNSSVWSEQVKGEKQWTIIDDGNEVKIKDITESFDYSKSHTLRVLMNLINHFEPNREAKYELVEVSITDAVTI